MQTQGILLINLGTPDNASPGAVYRYLKQFLNDPRVIDLPSPLRWILTNLIIVPFRYKQSAKAYQQIWTETGSPLLHNSIQLVNALKSKLGSSYTIELGMRYGNPSIASALKKLQHCDQLHIIPLFPQYATASTGSAIAEVLSELQQQWNIPSLTIQKDFYSDPGFIHAYSQLIKAHTANQVIDHYLFSYHGLPERHLIKSHCHAACNKQAACPAISSANSFCYRAQCFATTRAIAQTLSLSSDHYSVTFQSRLGRTPWIKPYTDVVLPMLYERGIKNIAIVCPSFVADCLETLEEINIRARADWQALGGNELTFIPCVNAQPLWVDALANMINPRQ